VFRPEHRDRGPFIGDGAEAGGGVDQRGRPWSVAMSPHAPAGAMVGALQNGAHARDPGDAARARRASAPSCRGQGERRQVRRRRRAARSPPTDRSRGSRRTCRRGTRDGPATPGGAAGKARAGGHQTVVALATGTHIARCRGVLDPRRERLQEGQPFREGRCLDRDCWEVSPCRSIGGALGTGRAPDRALSQRCRGRVGVLELDVTYELAHS